jgi:hypothetical protein
MTANTVAYINTDTNTSINTNIDTNTNTSTNTNTTTNTNINTNTNTNTKITVTNCEGCPERLGKVSVGESEKSRGRERHVDRFAC